MKYKNNERKYENTNNFKEVNDINFTLNCKSNIYFKNNEMKDKQKRVKKRDYTNKKHINNIKNNFNINMHTNKNKMKNFKNIDGRKEESRRLNSNFLLLKDKREFNDHTCNILKSSISKVNDNITFYEIKKKGGISNDKVKNFIQDIEISNSKWKNKFQMIEVYSSENKFISAHVNEMKQNMNNNVDNDNNSISNSHNLNNSNNDLKNKSMNIELNENNNFNNNNNNSNNNNNNNNNSNSNSNSNNNNNIFTYSDNQCMNNNSVNNILGEGYSLPLKSIGKNEREENKEFDNLNQGITNISNSSKTDKCEINHEKNEALHTVSDKSFFLEDNLEEENNLRINNTHEDVTNENIVSENILTVNNVNMFNSNENNINDIISNESNTSINIEREYFTNTNNENVLLNNTIRSRNSNENYSNAEELDYYVLTITNLRNTNENENNEEHPHFPEPRFLSKMFGYEIKPNLEECNMNRIIRTTLFIFILFILFSIEFSLLYNNILKLKIDSKLILVESNYNNTFLTNFLFQFNEKEINNLMITNDIIKEEINNGNFMLYNSMCVLLKKLKVTCNNLMDYYKTDHENTEKLYENTIRAFEELQKKDIIVYRVKESVFIRCNDITTKNLKNNDNNIFLFVLSKKYLKISKLFLIITLFFFFIRITLILSRILYEFIFLTCYRNYKMSLSCKRKYLAKYIWSVCTILILEIVLGDDCIIWWLHDVDPLFNYHFQYFIWVISVFCYLSFLFHKILRKYSETRNNYFSSIYFFFKFFHEFLFGANILFACVFILLNIHKSTIITIIVTIVVLLIDILNDSYVQQAQVISSQPHESIRPHKKKFYMIENKQKSVNVTTLIRINEHIYREIKSDNTCKSNDKNKDNSNSYKLDDRKWWNRKRKIFNLKNIFNNNYLNKKEDFKKSMSNNINTCNSNKLNDTNSSMLEFCEICDERCKNVVLYPCMHGGFCETCIRSMIINSLKSKDSLPHCPFCRDAIKNVYKISNEDDQNKVQANTILTIKTK
ncbi:zinc finger protein, putative [Plasmodium gallinaceum]|uniref:Zinc finger protein, putative n=1 Tax=Plasmodium gallinaceum TaxID=5849 RepID=A0A1J1GY37_PLAGA|nr:zinc finger protein, putative [Plasmodium gallinaceum]CRG95920.1 zinc finger protein, putative [Plasmodium gallinaceum]